MLKNTRIAGLLSALFLFLAAAQPIVAQRHRRRAAFRPRVRAIVVGGYRPYFFGGYGYPGFGIYGTPYRGLSHYGSVDFNVHPKESLIFVDGAQIGSADDFNGGFLGSTAKLPPGAHDILVVAPDGTEVRRKIYVMPGRELNFNYRF